MGTVVIDALIVAGVLAIFTMPVAMIALIGQGHTIQRLEVRNAAQGQTIAVLQRQLGAKPAAPVPAPPRGEWPAMRGDAFPSRPVDDPE